jgi:hypothetical protein
MKRQPPRDVIPRGARAAPALPRHHPATEESSRRGQVTRPQPESCPSNVLPFRAAPPRTLPAHEDRSSADRRVSAAVLVQIPCRKAAFRDTRRERGCGQRSRSCSAFTPSQGEAHRGSRALISWPLFPCEQRRNRYRVRACRITRSRPFGTRRATGDGVSRTSSTRWICCRARASATRTRSRWSRPVRLRRWRTDIEARPWNTGWTGLIYRWRDGAGRHPQCASPWLDVTAVRANHWPGRKHPELWDDDVLATRRP